MYREIKGLPEPDDEKKDKPESIATENPDTVAEKVETVEEKKDEAVLEVK